MQHCRLQSLHPVLSRLTKRSAGYLHREKQKSNGQRRALQRPSEVETPKQTLPPKKKETPEEKTARKKSEHGERVIRTLIACVLGMIAGITSYFIAGTPSAETGVQADPFIGILILLVAIVLQRTIFILLKIDTAKLGKKDWFYQAFMTFAMWYLSWTIILSTSLLAE